MEYYQQGDVLIKPLKGSRLENKIKTAKEERHSKLTLAEGEVTGHTHVLTGNLVKFVPQDNWNNDILFEVKEAAATISHEEHNSFNIPPGKYFVEKVREYDHFNEESRWVAD